MTIWQLWWFLLAIKIAIGPFLPITPDETYYFFWSLYPNLSYFDHPPFVAWVMTLAQPLWKTPLGVRLPGIILGHMAMIPWIFILRRLSFSNKATLFWMIAISLTPMIGIGSFIITPDIPFVLFWSLSLLWILITLDKPTYTNWAILGVWMGMGLLSKYVMVLFFISALLWMIWDKKLDYLKKPGLWMSIVIAFLVFSPVIIWNSQHQWASFLFQLNHGLGYEPFHWWWVTDYAVGQLGLLNPIFFVLVLLILKQKASSQKLLTVFTLLPFLFFFMSSFRKYVEANWPITAYPAAIALLALVIDDPTLHQKYFKWAKRGLILSFVFIFCIITHSIYPWIPIPPQLDRSQKIKQWQKDVAAVKDVHPLYARSYQMAAYHSFFRDKDRPVFKLRGFSRPDFFDFIEQSAPKDTFFMIMTDADRVNNKLDNRFSIKDPVDLPGQFKLFEMRPLQ